MGCGAVGAVCSAHPAYHCEAVLHCGRRAMEYTVPVPRVQRRQSMYLTATDAGTTLSSRDRRWTSRKPSALAAFAALVVANLSRSTQAFSLPAGTTTPTAAGGISTRGADHRRLRRRGSSCVPRSVSVAPGLPWPARQHHAAEPAALRPSRTRLRSTASTCANKIHGAAAALATAARRRRTTATSSSSFSASSFAVQCAPTADGSYRSGSSDRRSSSSDRPAAAGTAHLSPGDPIEFWHAKGLVFGNFERPVPGRQSLAVRTESGESLFIDAGQIVGLWRASEMRGPLPDGAAAWTEVRAEASALLQGMPARGLDLGPFWRAAGSRGKGFVVTPAHAAEFLFRESPSKLGLKKRRPFEFRGCVGLLRSMV